MRRSTSAHDGHVVEIVIRDDGKGMDTSRSRARVSASSACASAPTLVGGELVTSSRRPGRGRPYALGVPVPDEAPGASHPQVADAG